ncbi:MAG TPA: DUF5693 family protein [Fimbriimonadales bacterium]|nr:DUF5693 family protein [Fimbriimonadales bacterium]
MSPKFRPPVWLCVVLAITTGVCLWVAIERYRSESANRAVHLIVDMPDVRQLAAMEGETLPEALSHLKTAGITAVAVAEETMDDLVASGQVRTVGGSPPIYEVTDASLGPRLKRILTARFGRPAASPPGYLRLPDGTKMALPLRFVEIKPYGLGFDMPTMRTIHDSGLSVIARVNNPPLSTENAIRNVVHEATMTGAVGMIFGGDQVLGRRDLIPFAANQIRNSGIWVGIVEFSNQGGLSRMLKEMTDRAIRIHSMVAAEIDKNEPPDIIDRYVRAVVERNVKALFLRPISLASERPMAGFSDFVGKIRHGIEREGYEAKPSRPEYPKDRPAWAAVIASLGIALTSGWLIGTFANAKWQAGAFTLLILLTAGVGVGFGAKYMALVAALAFPTWAMLSALSIGRGPEKASVWFLAFFWVTGISVLGGLHVAALLTQLPYMMRLDQFFGVKAAHFIPPLVVGIYLLFEQISLRNILDTKIRWFDIAVLGVVLAAIFVMLLRTGNDSPGDVSSLELKMRNFLDRVLPERPRTKEFLIGHPAFILALTMAFRGERAFLPLMGLLAAVGQASVLNTFCHLHTPIAVSAMRVVTGIVVGGVIGIIVAWVYIKVMDARRRAA